MDRPLYIFSAGTLKRKDNTLFFENDEGQKKYIPVENTREVYLFGEITFNTKILQFLSQKGIMLHYYNYYDYYAGTFYPREHLCSGHVTVQQVSHYVDMGKRLLLARTFVSGAVANILRNLMYYKNRGKTELEENIDAIEKLSKGLKNAEKIEELMAIEGNIHESYYKAFDIIIDNPDMVFERRTRRPPRNELNSLISFANSMIYTSVLSEIYKTHLDPRIGYLHSSNQRRFTLNLDVAEIFKPVVADRVIFSVLNKRMITKKDFDDKSAGLLLREKGRKTFISEIESKFAQTIKHPSLSRNTSYRRLIRLELYKIEKHILEGNEYTPFVGAW